MLKVYQLRLKQNVFDVTLKYKGVGVRVTFADGNTYNGTPARFYTNDKFKQRAIESSKMFLDKDIVLERTVEEPGDKKAPAPTAVKRVRKSVMKPIAKPVEKKAPAPEPQKSTFDQAQGTPIPDQGENAPDQEPDGNKGGADNNEMTFENLGEAILFIAQKFQQQVTTDKEAREILKANGIIPHIKKG